MGSLKKNGTVDLAAFKKVPIMTKEKLRSLGENLHAIDHKSRGSFENTSGGSTGEPVVFLQDSRYKDWNIANKLYYAGLVGKQVGQREVKLWGSERDILQGSIGLKEQLMNFLYNRRLLNAFLMTEDDMRAYVAEIDTFRPQHIWVYVDSIYQLARFMEANSLVLEHPPASVITTAGVLTEEVRTYVESVLNTKVYNQYGSREVGDMAAEDKTQNGLNTFPWTHFLEITESGEILVTTLENYSMPLIRYHIGDTAEWLAENKYKVTQNTTPKLSQVTGRITNHFVRADGTVVHGEYFTHVFYFKSWVKRFKVIQEELDLVRCLVVLNGKPNPEEQAQMTADIRTVMGSDSRVVFEFVDEIAPSASGKYLYTESLVTKEEGSYEPQKNT
ncbi:phenylacetate--CoA ligase family protein [Candidatus Woesebacteria bacterium]|nr:phenylacetate--CoA ligase family protein [Candidatus Woesebacteria bacterium]